MVTIDFAGILYILLSCYFFKTLHHLSCRLKNGFLHKMGSMNKETLDDGKVAFAKTISREWILSHKRMLLIGCLTLCVLSVVLFRFFPSFSSGMSKANSLFYSAALETDLEELKKLEKMFQKEPFLRSQLGNELTQRFLSIGDVGKARRYAEGVQKHTRDLLSSYYARFAHNTFAISSGHYAQALDEAKLLKKDLEKDETFWSKRDKTIRSGSLLYAYNLIRIAALERALGSKEGELAAWTELVDNAGWLGAPKNMQMYDPEAYALIAQHFQKGEISFLDFINARKQALTTDASSDYTSP